MSALYLFMTAYLSETNGKKLLRYGLFYVACTLAFYTKGFIGIVIPALSILSFLVVEKNLKEIIRMKLWFGLLIFLAMTLPWFIALWHQAGPEYLNVFFVHNHLQRFFPARFARQNCRMQPPGTIILFITTSRSSPTGFFHGAFS
jgi:4-amino-4-deoxy-L-arabinose transferase-like glycosyltransferase